MRLAWLLLSILVLNTAFVAAEFPTEFKTYLFEGDWTSDGGKVGSLKYNKDGGVFQVVLEPPTVKNESVHEFKATVLLKDGVYITDSYDTFDMVGEFYPLVGRMYMRGMRRLSLPESIIYGPNTPEFGPENRTRFDNATLAWPPITQASINDTKDSSEAIFELFTDVHPVDNSTAITWIDRFNATFLSRDGDVWATADYGVDTHQAQFEGALRYAFMQLWIIIGLMWLTYKQNRRANSVAIGQRMATFSVILFSVQDCLVFISNAFLAIVFSPILSVFALCALLAFTLWLVLENQLVMTVWKARRVMTPGTSIRDARDAITSIYFRMYAVIIVIILLFLVFQWLIVKILFFGSFLTWIPQIWHQARSNSCRSFPVHYIIGSSLLRAFYLVYFFANPWNFIGFEPAPFSVAFILISGTVICAVLIIQQQKPRFFIPSFFKPKRYNYDRAVPEEVAERLTHQNDVEDGVAPNPASAVCVICMQPVIITAHAHMITPCDHVFHKSCLQQWMDVKLECPSCRSDLPLP